MRKFPSREVILRGFLQRQEKYITNTILTTLKYVKKKLKVNEQLRLITNAKY